MINRRLPLSIAVGLSLSLLTPRPIAWAASTAPATTQTRTIFNDVNHVGHVVLERGGEGTVLGTPHRYTPYGVLLQGDPVPQEVPRFGGMLRDPATGLDDFHARHLTSEYGRFISSDPAQDGSHYYTFANNNPLKYTDATGTMANPWWEAWNLHSDAAWWRADNLQFDTGYAAIDWVGTFLNPISGCATGFDELGLALGTGDLGELSVFGGLGALLCAVPAAPKYVVRGGRVLRDTVRARWGARFGDGGLQDPSMGPKPHQRRGLLNGIPKPGNPKPTVDTTASKVYGVVYGNGTETFLSTLPKKVQALVRARIDSLKINPRPSAAEKLVNSALQGYRIRQGRYRIFYAIDDAAERIAVHKIALRNERTYRAR